MKRAVVVICLLALLAFSCTGGKKRATTPDADTKPPSAVAEQKPPVHGLREQLQLPRLP